LRKKFSHNTQDEYNTPFYAVDIITPHIPKNKIIWCPFDKKESKYVIRLKNTNEVHYTHIDDGQDFLNYEPDFDFDIIVSNPPFSIKNEVLKKCYAYNKPFALLLPMTMFNSISTISVLKNDIQFIIMDRRISFNGERPNFTCWYVCRNLLPTSNIIYKFNDDPRKLYENEPT
jgi:hypothetical protein